MSDQTRDIVQAVGRRLDDARDLLDAAVEQATALERSLREHEYTVNDVHWDAAKLLLEPHPGRPTLHLIHTKAADLAEQLRHSTITADQIHDKLIAAGRQLQHTDRLIGALAADSTDPERAAAVAALSSRAERLSTLVAAATPLADRAHQQPRRRRADRARRPHRHPDRRARPGPAPTPPARAPPRPHRAWPVRAGHLTPEGGHGHARPPALPHPP